MKQVEYSVSEAAKLAEVKAHVLRYWEDELHLPIHRNDLGHRYYTQKDIQIFLSIKEMKRRGLQLKEIEKLTPFLYQELEIENPIIIEEIQPKKKREIPEQFYEILEKLVQVNVQEDMRSESHYKRLDAVIRASQQKRRLIAATAEQDKKSKEKRKMFRRKPAE